jgi:hypothetical protein
VDAGAHCSVTKHRPSTYGTPDDGGQLQSVLSSLFSAVPSTSPPHVTRAVRALLLVIGTEHPAL